MERNQNPRNIVFITGCFVGNNCWDNWQEFFQNNGYHTVAPPWPFKDGSAQEQRSKHPSGNRGLAKLTLKELVDHYEDIVNSYDEKPIVIGHSMGGLITQILVNRGVVAAGVAIHSVQPAGVFPYEFPLFKLGWKFLGLFSNLNNTYLISFKDWQYAFTNGMSIEVQHAAYNNFTIPESKRVNLGGLTSAAAVDFEASHPPLLLTSGTTDNLIPAHLNFRNFKKYTDPDSITEYKEFTGRNHFVLGQPTWREDAEDILQWIAAQFEPVSSILVTPQGIALY